MVSHIKKLLILGNAKDRLKKEAIIKEWDNEIWVCNSAYKESLFLNKISIVASVHQEDAEKALDFKIKNNLSYTILSNQIWKIGINIFTNYRGWSTGTELIHEAILRGFDEIYLSGFSFINNDESDIYNSGIVYCGNFKKQFEQIKQEYQNHKILFL